VKHGRISATLPKDVDEKSVTFEEALVLLAEKASKTKAKTGGAKKKGEDAETEAKPKKAAARKKTAKKAGKGGAKTARRKSAKAKAPAVPDVGGGAEAAE
jgi:DNA topoisomerase-1